MENLQAVISLIVLVLVIIVIYYIYAYFSTFPIWDCPKYGNPHSLGLDGGPICDTGAESYGGVCYNDVWTANGGTKTAVCTVEYPGSFEVVTNCFIGIQDIEQGAPCSDIPGWNRGPGWYKSAVCSCQHGGIVIAGMYCKIADEGTPRHCPDGSDYFESECWSEACPAGYKRTEFCSCSYIG